MADRNDSYRDGFADGYAAERFPATDEDRVNETRAQSDSDYRRGVQDGVRSGDSDRSDVVGG